MTLTPLLQFEASDGLSPAGSDFYLSLTGLKKGWVERGYLSLEDVELALSG